MSPDLPPPGPDTVNARLTARHEALTALGGAVELHGWTTERLVEAAAARGRSRSGGEQ